MTATTSIIITTKNRRDELRRAVQSAVEQVGCTEVLIFDDGSSDGTSELIEREFPTVRLKRVEQSLGIVSARNRAIEEAKGEIVFTIDDDCVFSSPFTVLRTLDDFDAPNVGAVAIPHINVLRVPVVAPPPLSGLPPYVVSEFAGGSSAVRRDLFRRLRGYRSAIWRQGEEYDFCTRLLSDGWFTRAGTAPPVMHFESPNRDRASIYFHRVRSHVLYAWWNVPNAHLPVHMSGTIANTISHAARHGHLNAGLGGLWAGLCTAFKTGGRRPVSKQVYKLMRQLHTQGPRPLGEIKQTVPPPTPPCRLPNSALSAMGPASE
jgi:glycosyltransferase involved in cell wall biosynthesis